MVEIAQAIDAKQELDHSGLIVITHWGMMIATVRGDRTPHAQNHPSLETVWRQKGA